MRKLTARFVSTVKPNGKKQRFADGDGLILQVSGKGSKSWAYRALVNGKDKIITFGKYPAYSLAEARVEAEKYQLKHHRGKSLVPSDNNNFEYWYLKWLAYWSPGKAAKTVEGARSRTENHLLPAIGHIDVTHLTKDDIRKPIENCVQNSSLDMAIRVLSLSRQILQHAADNEHLSGLEHNIGYDVRREGLIPKFKRKNFARVPTHEIPKLAYDISQYQGDIRTVIAIKLMMYTFVRTNELIKAEWSEIDWRESIWRIPAERMKMDTEHIVPLSSQALDLLKALKVMTGMGKYLFPPIFGRSDTMSNNTILKALSLMGYKGKMTGHGFRGVARTKLGEMGYDSEWLELQLAHLAGSQTERAYNHAKHLVKRAEMLQDWADYLDKARDDYAASL